LLDEALALFGIVPDLDLGDHAARAAAGRPDERGSSPALDVSRWRPSSPAAVLAQGDTTSGAGGGARRLLPAHPLHATSRPALRTGDLGNPFPEEMNRVVAGRLAALHFAPYRAGARRAAAGRGPARKTLFVTGNTVIDALAGGGCAARFPTGSHLPAGPAHRPADGAPARELRCLRWPEIYGGRCASWRGAIPELHFVYPVHPNPNVAGPARETAGRHGGGHAVSVRSNMAAWPTLLQESWLVLTDSGGLQEEAPALGKPVLVSARGNRAAGGAGRRGSLRLVGHDRARIVASGRDPAGGRGSKAYRGMAQRCLALRRRAGGREDRGAFWPGDSAARGGCAMSGLERAAALAPAVACWLR
jgi:UDP-N-acetylglucosamine 2-epimerase (non-hydrolysing)